MIADLSAALEDVLRSLNNLQEDMHRGKRVYAYTSPRSTVMAAACAIPAALLLTCLGIQVHMQICHLQTCIQVCHAPCIIHKCQSCIFTASRPAVPGLTLMLRLQAMCKCSERASNAVCLCCAQAMASASTAAARHSPSPANPQGALGASTFAVCSAACASAALGLLYIISVGATAGPAAATQLAVRAMLVAAAGLSATSLAWKSRKQCCMAAQPADRRRQLAAAQWVLCAGLAATACLSWPAALAGALVVASGACLAAHRSGCPT